MGRPAPEEQDPAHGCAKTYEILLEVPQNQVPEIREGQETAQDHVQAQINLGWL